MTFRFFTAVRILIENGFCKISGKSVHIDGEIADNHAILIDHFKFDGEYSYQYNMKINIVTV